MLGKTAFKDTNSVMSLMLREIARFCVNCLNNKENKNEFEKSLVSNGKKQKQDFKNRIKLLEKDDKEYMTQYKIRNDNVQNEFILGNINDDMNLENMHDLDETERMIDEYFNEIHD